MEATQWYCEQLLSTMLSSTDKIRFYRVDSTDKILKWGTALQVNHKSVYSASSK